MPRPPWTLPDPGPPRYVEYAREEPSALSLLMNPSVYPDHDVLNAPAVVGKSEEVVSPVT
jgi:hypothetical protein